ncbi:phage NrS-1 polymerase family protein [Deinococcus marmoris]|uniref:phage NrS-1 polymerase family protein n=1 Tax=Deinococcus marmoris TaxID=249408 RepID=UPI00096AA5FC|nr:hypothetical protein [Deinococcus marmoris]
MSAVSQDALIARVEAHWPLLDRPRWWLWQRRHRANGKLGKVPVSVGRGGMLIPHAATDSRAWRSWAEVRSDFLAGMGDGVGFALGDGVACLDLDDCLDLDGVPDALAAGLLAELPGYAEKSPSGRGLHLLAWAGPTLNAGNQRAGRLELLRTGLVTVTGDTWPGHARELSSSATLTRVWAQPGPPRRTLPVPARTSRSPPEIADLLQVAARFRNAERFFALWTGDLSRHRSASESDFALCRHLYFLIGPDVDAIDAAFRASALYQRRPENWHRLARTGPLALTYGQLTVRRAVACGGPTLPPPTL